MAFMRCCHSSPSHPFDERHTSALVDDDLLRARHAVAATAAEIAGKLGALGGDERAHPFVKLRRFGHERKPLIELFLALHAPDGQHARELGHERHAGAGVSEQAAGQAFHGDKADVALLAQGNQLKLAVGGKVAERVLQRFVQAAFHALEGNLELVRRHADVGNLALLLGLEHALVHAGAVAWLVALVDAVELV